MSTISEIEAAAEALSTEQKRELFLFLAARLPSNEGQSPQFKSTDLHAFEGVLSLREDPLEYQSRSRTEWR